MAHSLLLDVEDLYLLITDLGPAARGNHRSAPFWQCGRRNSLVATNCHFSEAMFGCSRYEEKIGVLY